MAHRPPRHTGPEHGRSPLLHQVVLPPKGCLLCDIGTRGSGWGQPGPAAPPCAQRTQLLLLSRSRLPGESRGQRALGRGTGLLVGAVTEKEVSLHCLGHSPEAPTSPAVAREHSQEREAVCESVSAAVGTPGNGLHGALDAQEQLQHQSSRLVTARESGGPAAPGGQELAQEEGGPWDTMSDGSVGVTSPVLLPRCLHASR